jgi:hypothetical protein
MSLPSSSVAPSDDQSFSWATGLEMDDRRVRCGSAHEEVDKFFFLAQDGEEYQVSVWNEPGYGLQITLAAESSTIEDKRGHELSLGQGVLRLGDKSLEEGDSLLEQALEDYSRTLKNPYTVPHTLNDSTSDEPEIRPEERRALEMLQNAVHSMPERKRLDQEACERIKERYEDYESKVEALPAKDVAVFKGHIRATLLEDHIDPHDTNVWEKVRSLAAAIGADDATERRKIMLAHTLTRDLIISRLAPSIHQPKVAESAADDREADAQSAKSVEEN